MLLAGAGMLLATLVALQTANTGYDTRQVLAFDIPTSATGVGMGDAKVLDFYQEATRRIGELPGVDGVAVGSFVPWRDAGSLGPGASSSRVDGYKPRRRRGEPARADSAWSRPRFFAVLGVPIVAGRDFTDEDRAGSEPVVDRQPERRAAAVPERRRREPHVWWTDP